ncbi:hypothetical protein Ahy_A02g008884 [Arachis hypogaea]|uniref:WRKY domain-containing protein n=1 Tax=Arachis hypogaea TaxID=3818 RepID=A0A445EFM7_ARAHY|nr:hypothetical protein Ahy_A02g008884 [Arachis hypogaea]
MEEVEQANRLAVESCHRVLSILSQPRDQVQNRNLMVETGEAVLRFKKVVSLLQNGLGHARVRKHRKLQVPFSQSILLDNPNCFKNNNNNLNHDQSKKVVMLHENSVQELGSNGSVANLDGSSFHLIGAPLSSDQNSQQHKRKCSARGDEGSVKCGSSARCHCSKKRKHRVKRSIKVPAISNKLADIPPDDYSWRKYGQKPIKGSPHPRGYYKCSSMRGCPARKHVERCLEEPTMLIVTYEGEHNHPKLPTQSANA